jgi:ribosomal protein S27AE
VRWPVSHQDATEFGFEKTMIVPSGGLVVVAGVSNMGKTGLLQNFCVENCEQYHVTMMINEANKSKFKRRIQRMTWFNPRGDDGKVKFDLIERHGEWKYAIQPNDINIIDWIDLPDGDFYKINGILDGIKSRLNKGIALVALQKSEGKTLGTGGQFSEHLADIYLNIDFQRLTVRKCKEWNAPNPNNKVWGFEIVEGGSQFADIREIKLCPRCGGRSLAAHTHCEDCRGTGYVDVIQ